MQLTLGATTRPWGNWSFAEACSAIAAAGYSDVAIYGHKGTIPVSAESTPDDIAAVRSAVQGAGLVASMVITRTLLDVPLEMAVADYRKAIDAAAAAGITWVMNGGCEQPELYDAFQKLMRECAPYAAVKGLRLLMKPHGGIGLTGQMMRRVVEAVDHPNFSICYDPGNIIYYTKGEHRPETDVHAIKEHVSVCIIKDCVVNNGVPDVHLLPGEGLVDFRRVLGALVDAGFRGPLYVECVGGTQWDDINDRARRTHAFVSDLLARL
ncbi:MAG: sugar phosphate isomerase/epimerase [Armatimonadetes bacterium]|nr:sugar phosphate isomerase/epimerase [Armatimonadota bacterium]